MACCGGSASPYETPFPGPARITARPERTAGPEQCAVSVRSCLGPAFDPSAGFIITLGHLEHENFTKLTVLSVPVTTSIGIYRRTWINSQSNCLRAEAR